LSDAEPLAKLGCWADAIQGFDCVAGYTAFGDVFLRDSSSGQYGLLFPLREHLEPLDQQSLNDLQRLLATPVVVEKLLRLADLEILESRLGPLQASQVYFPVPYPFIGGSGALDTYDKGDVWAFLELVGQFHGYGDAIRVITE
jgi:hypothetical protein